MASEVTERFIKALEETEIKHELRRMVELFSEDAEMVRVTGQEHCKGKAGVERFWKEYLSAFHNIHSEFLNVVESDNQIVLEWVSQAETDRGKPLEYRGVTILETEGGQVKKFRTYYDSAKFIQAH